MGMKTLNAEKFNFNLNEETRKQGLLILGKVYSMHILEDNTVIITDNEDYSKIYVITTTDFYNRI